MNKALKIISSFVVLLSISVILIFRSIPAGKLWQDYSVLYVPDSTEDSLVISALENAGIDDVVALSNQFLPLNISEDSLEYAMYKINIGSDSNAYVENRNSYFFDKSKNFRIYYIPSSFEHKINKAISILENNHIPCGLDASSGYPILFPIVVLLITAAICIFSRQKVLFAVLSIIPNIYVFCNPFFPVALSTALLILCVFFITNVWKRKGAVEYIKNFVFIPACFILGCLCGFSSSLKSGFMFLICSVGVLAVLFTYSWIEEYIYNKKSFIPVNIRPAKMVSILSDKSKPVPYIFGAGAVILLGVFFLTSSGLVNSSISSNVILPGSGNVASSSLPQLEDYYDWAWNVSTYPYQSLNSESGDASGCSVEFPTFTAENGLITETIKVLNYDDNFKSDIYNGINNLQFNSIEKVMKSEGNDFKGNYCSGSSYHIDLFGIILIIICYLILLFIYFSIIITRKGTKK